MRRVAYQGTKASFSEIAAHQFFGAEVECIGKTSFQDVFESLVSGEVEHAALPIENSLIGPIFENFDLFNRYDVSIIGELCLPIEHCLVGKGTMMQIEKVLSHPKALAQCTGFFKAHPHIEPCVHYDTAGAAAEIAGHGNPAVAAIASRKTAEVYGLDILKENLEDDRSNTTRFVFLKRGKAEMREKGKCSLLFTLPHRPGALVSALKALEGLNLTQIVSRPIREKPFEYLFFVDVMFSCDIEPVLKALSQHTETLKLLGTYA